MDQRRPVPSIFVMPTTLARNDDAGVGHGSDTPSHPGANSITPSARRVLVVDDDAYIHVGVRAALKGLRCEIRSASTGCDALEVASTWRPEIAILDVGLPDTDGYQLAYDLRADPALATMRIIFLTGHLPDQLAVEVIGGNLFLGKPYRIQVLATAVRGQLASLASSA